MPDLGLSKPDIGPDPEAATVSLDVPGDDDRCHRKRRRAIAAVVVGILVITVGLAIMLARRLQPSASTSALVGQRAPAFVLDRLAGASGSVSLASFAGRPGVINFWASWCVPCRTEMPALEAVHEALGGQVAFVGIDHQDDHTAAVEFIDYTGVTYESGFDPQGIVAAAYGLYGLPTTVLVSADGIVVAALTGAVTEDRLLALIHDRLGITPD